MREGGGERNAAAKHPQLQPTCRVCLSSAGGATLPLPCSTEGALGKVALVGPGAAFTGTATSSYIGNYSPCEVRSRGV